jgi:hypothetical protein
MWYRVFGTNDVDIVPEAVLSHLDGVGCPVTGAFRGDDAGWFQAELACAGSTPIVVERFLASEEGIRAELNSWAAYLETCQSSPNAGRLMEHMIGTKQLFTIRRPADGANDEGAAKRCLALARFFARTTEGVYQIDEQGFFDADGILLVREQ